LLIFDGTQRVMAKLKTNIEHRDMSEDPNSSLDAVGNVLRNGSVHSGPLLMQGSVPASFDMQRGRGYFNTFAQVLAENGFTVIPTSGKNPVTKKWQNPRPTDLGWLMKMIRHNRYPENNVGIVCGRVIGIDIDADRQEEADRLQALAFEHLGETKFVRVGRAPRRLLLYRAVGDIASTKVGCIDILALGRQFVAYGIHPDTGQNYRWADSHCTPATASIDSVPTTTAQAVCNFTAVYTGQGRSTDLPAVPKASAGKPASKLRAGTGQRSGPQSHNCYDARIARDESGLVVDGREALLAKLTAAEYARGHVGDDLAKAVWVRFSTEADLSRPKGSNPRHRWAYRDALAKARSTCRRKPDLKSPRRAGGRHPTAGLHAWLRPRLWTIEKRQQHVAEVARHEGSAPSVIAVARAMIDAVDFDTGFCMSTIADIASRCNCSVTAVKSARRELNKAGFWMSIRGVYVPIPLCEPDSAQALPSKRKRAPAGQPESHSAPARRVGQLIQKKEKKGGAGHPKVAPMYHLVTVSGAAGRTDGAEVGLDGPATTSAPLASSSPSGPAATSSARPPYQPDLFEGPAVDLESYGRGRLSPDLATAIRQECRALGMSQADLARQIGVSRPQLANALAGRVGVSPEPAARLLDWLKNTVVS
jgi:hypothetical protein